MLKRPYKSQNKPKKTNFSQINPKNACNKPVKWYNVVNWFYGVFYYKFHIKAKLIQT